MRPRMDWIRWALLIQLLFFIGWAGKEEWNRREVRDDSSFLIETMPVDPRDLWSGHYMTLRFRISTLAGMTTRSVTPAVQGLDVKVKLVRDREVELQGRKYDVYRGTEWIPASEAPGRMDGVWASATLGSQLEVLYGIERYYFSEDRKDEMNKYRPGQYYVKVSVGKDGRFVLKDLVQ